MNAEKFFEQYSIEEISKKTKISPISLRFIKNKEFEKIPRVKFIGFIKLIEREFKVDLSELIEEFDQSTGTKKEHKEIKKTPQQPPNPKEEKGNLLYFLIVAILIISGIAIYKITKKTQKNPPKQEFNISTVEINKTEKNETLKTQKNNTPSISEINTTKNTVENKPTQKKPKATEIKQITIIPHEKVWYRAVNLDTNKTYEYLTTKPHTLPGNHYYIKFGHGNITIEYGDQNITPNTKKIVRILLENGKYKYLKKGIR